MIKKLKNRGNDEKIAPQASQKIGYFGVFFGFLVFIPPLVNDKSETRGGINTRNTIDLHLLAPQVSDKHPIADAERTNPFFTIANFNLSPRREPVFNK